MQRASVIKSALENIVHRLSALPSSAEVEALRARAEEYRRDADAWTASHPGVQEKERLMKCALKLHVQVSKLERETRGV